MATKKIAVVTGANQGIGFAVAKHLAALPDIHVILTSRDVAKGQQAVAELASLGRTVELEQLDVADEASITAFAKRVLEKHGRVDILVNNAGIASPRGWNTSFLDAKVEDINTVFQTNTIGPLRLCQLFVPVMVKNNYGRIVNMSSGAGQISDMNGKNVDYRISKISLNALTKIINDEMKDKNVIVNSMCPGIVRTAMTKGATIPADRIKEPDVPAETAVWLATLPDSGPRGGFFRNKQPIAW